MMIGIGEGIAAAKLALDASTKALDELRRPNIESEKVRNYLIAMQDHILSAQRALNEAENDNHHLRRQIQELLDANKLARSVVFHDSVCWVLKDGSEDGPYCPVCWGDSQKLVPPSVWDTQPTKLLLMCNNHKSPIHFTIPAALGKGYGRSTRT